MYCTCILEEWLRKTAKISARIAGLQVEFESWTPRIRSSYVNCLTAIFVASDLHSSGKVAYHVAEPFETSSKGKM
jgi:hypothetical protein